MSKNGFTLIELLVVVLIIGILAAIAMPQYEKAVEKARMAEGVSLVRAIAEANKSYYLATGNYANHINQLDINLQGAETEDRYPGTGEAGARLQTKYFVYTASSGQDYAAIAQREPAFTKYYISVRKTNPKISCVAYENSTGIQKELCENLNTNGSL